MNLIKINLLIPFAFILFCTIWLSSCVPLVATGIGVGAGTGALMSEDRRSTGIFIEDEAIELKASRRITQQLGSNVHINVTSFNRNVLLTGETPNDAMKNEAEKLALSIDNVRKVFNEITIAENSALSSRTNDSIITSKVKGRFISERKFRANYVKVVTENSVVYLLGLVTREEGEDASQIASTTAGVTRVVKVFEYLN